MASEALPARPMLRSVLSKTLRDQRRALGWWSLGLIGTVLMYAGVYPSIRANAETLNEYLDSFPEILREAFLAEGVDFASPAGYLSTELFGLFGPLLLVIFAVGAGTRAIAGEEERRTLDVLLATPITRRSLVTQKFGAMVAGVGLLCAVTWVSVAVIGPPFDLDLGLGRLAAATVSAGLLAIAFGSVGLAIGCATGRRSIAIGVTAGLAAATYLFDILAPSVEAIAWLERLSPFYYYGANQPLLNGLLPLHAIVLALIASVGFASALVALERRDVAA